MSNLLKLLQPKDYKSKIKLYCNNSTFNIKKFGNLDNNFYICQRIKIQEVK